MGLNTSGTLDTGEYTLGRGIVYLAALVSNLPTAYRDIGNTTEFNITIETETLEHQSSRSGLAVIDKEIVTSQKMSLSLTFDSINSQNLALFFSGDVANQNLVAATDTVAATTSVFRKQEIVAGSVTETAFDTDDQPFWFDLFRDRYAGSPNLTRLYNVEGDTTTNAWNTAGAGVVLEATDSASMNAADLEEGTHFTVDRVMGRIFITTAGMTVLRTSSRSRIRTKTAQTIAPAANTTVDEVRALRQTSVAVAMKFVQENPANNGSMDEYQFHKVTLRSEGDFSLIGEDWTQGQLSGTVEENTTADPDSPYCTHRTYQQTA